MMMIMNFGKHNNNKLQPIHTNFMNKLKPANRSYAHICCYYLLLLPNG